MHQGRSVITRTIGTSCDTRIVDVGIRVPDKISCEADTTRVKRQCRIRLRPKKLAVVLINSTLLILSPWSSPSSFHPLPISSVSDSSVFEASIAASGLRNSSACYSFGESRCTNYPKRRLNFTHWLDNANVYNATGQLCARAIRLLIRNLHLKRREWRYVSRISRS